MKTNTTNIILLLLCCTTLFQSLQAYCVYNDTTNKSVSFDQVWMRTKATYIGLFKAPNMQPAGKQCCPYSNTDCNESGVIDRDLLMHISVDNANYKIPFPAGGWIDILDYEGSSNDGEQVTIKVYNADGSVYETNCDHYCRITS